MAEVKCNSEKYEGVYALQNVINYYGYGDGFQSSWQKWKAYGVNQDVLELAMQSMYGLKKAHNKNKGTQLHQIMIVVSAEEIKMTFGRSSRTAEDSVIDFIGEYLLRNGLQSICFKYKSKKGIFLRFIVNSVTLNGKLISNIKPFTKEIEFLLKQKLNCSDKLGD